jgi:hypothetical protein
MNRAFGKDTEVMAMIAEMACNLDPETVDMRRWHSRDCNSKHCILGHAQARGIINNWDMPPLFNTNLKWFDYNITLTPKEIGYQILNELGVEHI